jgi:hypothetical protein
MSVISCCLKNLSQTLKHKATTSRSDLISMSDLSLVFGIFLAGLCHISGVLAVTFELSSPYELSSVASELAQVCSNDASGGPKGEGPCKVFFT